MSVSARQTMGELCGLLGVVRNGLPVLAAYLGQFFLFAGYDALSGMAIRIVQCISVIPNWIVFLVCWV